MGNRRCSCWVKPCVCVFAIENLSKLQKIVCQTTLRSNVRRSYCMPYAIRHRNIVFNQFSPPARFDQFVAHKNTDTHPMVVVLHTKTKLCSCVGYISQWKWNWREKKIFSGHVMCDALYEFLIYLMSVLRLLLSCGSPQLFFSSLSFGFFFVLFAVDTLFFSSTSCCCSCLFSTSPARHLYHRRWWWWWRLLLFILLFYDWLFCCLSEHSCCLLFLIKKQYIYIFSAPLPAVHSAEFLFLSFHSLAQHRTSRWWWVLVAWVELLSHQNIATAVSERQQWSSNS